ncbi:sugar ABC transporter permease [Duganella sp. BJB488]|uniref:carbohydrate ABC transporter permease n=1 Tax=unclassified Duganella TaxID=2636909 RepID=UPI000E347242|nr:MULTISPECIES: sugar ABC transporter permease [unclassified Duganella]NVD73396.1 sugar ABC transporter permease [Duganella sp. BJB1802]RFP21856.1 sugar ABC transporter permease [Duganella sp. BJB489]RFP23649.1 sugar ABC transporter permease [Duganella sp. BJB488]RFP38815.1 sugar ABC transporter permease [Duganella sp. BJB480]
MKLKLGQDSPFAVALFASPAVLLFMLFVALPLLLAAGATLTNHRLMSPEPTRYIGLDNYRRLLALDLAVVEPLREAGAVLRDEDGVRYPTWRQVRRLHPELGAYREAFHLDLPEALGGARWVLAASDPLFYRSLINTFLFALLVLPLQCGVALGLAVLVNQKIRGRIFFRTVYFAPVVTSMVVASIVWAFMLNTDRGMLNELLRGLLGDPNAGPDWLGDSRYALPAIALMSAWQGAGFQMLVFLAGLQSISPELYEAATLMGANAWQRFVHVTLPGLRNTIVFVLVSTTLLAFGLFTQVDVMTSGGPLDSTSTVVYHAVRSGFKEQDVGYGSTITLVFFVIVLALSWMQRALVAKGEK